MASRPRAPALASGLLARPGGAPARSTPVEDLPRPSPALASAIGRNTAEPPAATGGATPSGGIKEKTIGTTLYLIPAEHKRVKRLALDLDVPVHELILMGLDRLLAEQGQEAVTRYSVPRPKKG